MDKNIELNDEIKVLELKLKPLYKQRDKLREVQREAELDEMVGSKWKYLNDSYSCPKTKSDYWTDYMEVLKNKNGFFERVYFIDSSGHIHIEDRPCWGEVSFGYIRIMEKEFRGEVGKILGRLNND